MIQEGNLQEREEPQEPKKGGDAEDREDHEPKEAKQQAQASAASAASEKMRREEDLRGSEQDSKESRQEEGKELREHEGEFNGDDVESCEKAGRSSFQPRKQGVFEAPFCAHVLHLYQFILDNAVETIP